MQLTLTEKTVSDPGYRRAYTPARDDTTQTPHLTGYQRGQKVQPSIRIAKRVLTEGALIRLLQASGVGRPSTYAATLEALRRHGYLDTRQGGLVVTGSGQKVLAFLEARYPFLLEVGFSAAIEAHLDDLACGRRSYLQVVQPIWERVRDA